jgi:hypothetical protein
VKESGLRYKVDRLAESAGPIRSVDAWALKHPFINVVSFVAIGVGFGVLLSLVLRSWPAGMGLGVVIALFTVFSTRANHRRRLQNGTSAVFGEPKRRP